VTTTSTVAPREPLGSERGLQRGAIDLPCVSGVAAHARRGGSTWSRWPAGTACRMAAAGLGGVRVGASVGGREGMDVGVAEFINDIDDGVGESASREELEAVWRKFGVGWSVE